MRRIGVPVDQLPDDALLAGFGRGDAEVTVAFVRRFQSRVYGVALAVTGDPMAAEDVAQIAFERAWRSGHTYDPRRASVATWLSVLTRNVAIDGLRVRRPSPIDADALLGRAVSDAPDPANAAVADDDAGRLRAALGRLPDEQARAVVLAGMAGFSASQVAEAEGIPLGTAKTRIRNGLRRLRDVMHPEEAR